MDAPDITTHDRDLDAYLRSFTGEDATELLLGHTVIYNVADVEQVTTDELRNWFEELELDTTFLPGPPRDIEAFEKATSSAKVTYPIGGKKRRDHGKTGQTATLMMRNVARDETRIVRHLVWELADHADEALSYEVRVAEAEFVRDNGPTAADGAGTMRIEPADIDQLALADQSIVTELLGQVEQDYEQRRHYVGANRLRKILRDYAERQFHATRLHSGVYFVHRQYAEQLANLRVLADRFGGELIRIPVPNTTEMRGVVDGAFRSKITTDLESLARDLAREQTDGPKRFKMNVLDQRFQTVRTAVADHQQMMDSHLTDVEAQLQLVSTQMAGLWIALGHGDDDDQPASTA